MPIANVVMCIISTFLPDNKFLKNLKIENAEAVLKSKLKDIKGARAQKIGLLSTYFKI